MTGPRLLILACGALTRELAAIVKLNRLTGVTIESLPASLHNRPNRIPGAVRKRLERACATADGDDGRPAYDRILVGYADCGTGGDLDRVCAEFGATRLPGVHCYEFFAGVERFADLSEAEPGTLYLTDYLARHFDRNMWAGLGLDDHPELRDSYFGNYRRVVLLSQSDDPAQRALVAERAERAARRLGLPLEIVHTGYDGLAGPVSEAAVGLPTRSAGRASRRPAGALVDA
ncbi:MAG TPA: hypothetical protein DEP66_06070 [Acidimicrobiaceae bacterium]|nr:hypothetical protein [Acidimicrobiaceae bacterium]HCB37757.1 hypothetical protein [Acidimicrobiaceae bacterium]